MASIADITISVDPVFITKIDELIAALKAFTPPAQTAPESRTVSSVTDATSNPDSSGAAAASSTPAKTSPPAATSSAVTTPAVDPPADEAVTMKMVQDIVLDIIKNQPAKKPLAAKALEKYGAKKATEVKESDFAKCFADLKALKEQA